MKKQLSKILYSVITTFLLPLSVLHAQQLELYSGSGPSGTNGPTPAVANANSTSPVPAATLYQNTGTSTTFTSYTPATTFKLNFTNQQHTSGSYPGLLFGGNLAYLSSTIPTTAVWQPFNWSSPSASDYTSDPFGTPGTNFSLNDNYGYEIFTYDSYIRSGSSTFRNYYGDLVVTFNRPVMNPVLQLLALGGYDGTVGYFTELELSTADVSSGITLTRLSGSTHFVLDATNTKILNDATTSSTASDYSSQSALAGGGSLRVNSSAPVTSLTFRVYLKGIGGSFSVLPSVLGDGWNFGVSLGLRNISGNVFLDNTNDGTVNGTGTNAGGLYANLVDASGNVYATTAVLADGTYSFTNVVTSNYTVILTTSPGTTGSALSASTLPAGYISTGENVGTGAGTDGTADGKLAVSALSTNVTNANFGINSYSVLPVSLVNFNATTIRQTVQLNWQISAATNITNFGILRSNDAVTWLPIGNVVANVTGMAGAVYNFTDGLPAPGTNYYQLRIFDIEGNFTESYIARATISNDNIIIDPNPVTSQMHIRNMKNISMLKIYDLNGRMYMSVPVHNTSSTTVHTEALENGAYFISFIDGNGIIVSRSQFLKTAN